MSSIALGAILLTPVMGGIAGYCFYEGRNYLCATFFGLGFLLVGLIVWGLPHG